MVRTLVPWQVADRPARELTGELTAALDGSGPALAPEPPIPLDDRATRVPDEVAVVVHTSGSTGAPRGVLLGAEALLASARATHDRLGGPGRWLLALPARHVAGVQVLVRSVLAGTTPLDADPSDVRAIAEAAGHADYTSLVPAQLHRVVAAAQAAGGLAEAGLAGLAGLRAILLGGAATSSALLAGARDLGLTVVTTYGSSETSGGCVYDGVPLAGVRVALDDGVVLLGGPTLASGYLDGGEGFLDRDGDRWFRTADLGRWVEGRLEVLGRRDDVLVVGGVKVAPQAVEQVVGALPGVAEVCVVGVGSERWGQVPVAVVVPGPSPTPIPDLDQVRATVTAALGSAAAPRRVVTAAELPTRGPGKVDRAAVARLAARDTAD